ncbi:MAG TPA: ribosome maturation factor RimM [Chryseosolibacter sp.]|nr:ribosome maturation factor RimM [Chryseosolibacter sp.]
MKLAQCYKVGYVMKPHGLKGEVTISLDAESPADLESIESLFLEKGNVLVPYFVENISVSGMKAFVKFEDIDTPEAANYISKSSIYLPKSSRPKSGKGKFYDDEIIGFEVNDEVVGHLGIVNEITQAGPNKLLSVIRDDKEVLIPVNGPFITSINKSKKLVSVSLPDGFLDL